ncbi:unnamed protein product, partial [Musa banksii]
MSQSDFSDAYSVIQSVACARIIVDQSELTEHTHLPTTKMWYRWAFEFLIDACFK